MQPECTFCKIAGKHIPVSLVDETENVVCFADIKPQAEFHLLVVPKKHIADFSELKTEDMETLSEMVKVAQNQIAKYSMREKGFRIVMNGGPAAHVPHLHMHLLGGFDTHK